METKLSLKDHASKIWNKAQRGDTLTNVEKSVMRIAYWASVLPSDSDYSVAQWVEDGMPTI
jgi:hypothetical protein